ITEPGADPEPDSFAKPVLRPVGLTARAAARGATSFVGTLANAPAAAYNTAADLYDAARAPSVSELVTGKRPGFRFADQTRFADWASDKAGLPAPANALERGAGDVASAMTGQGAVARLASFVRGSARPVVSAVAERLAAGPGTQVAA